MNGTSRNIPGLPDELPPLVGEEGELTAADFKHFRATHPGRQTAINDTLVDYVKQHGK